MNTFINIFLFYLKRRNRDFFIIIYNVILPIMLILILGYLMEPSYFGKIITSFQYYYIVLIPFCTALSITTSLYNSKEDRREKVSERIFSSPADIHILITTKIISSAVSLTFITTSLIILGWFILDFKNFITLMLLILLNIVFIFFCTSFGYVLGLSTTNDDAVRSYLGLPTCILAFLGGCFFPVGTTNIFLDIIIKLSPFYWFNKSIFSIIYDSNYNIFIILFNLFLFSTILLFIFSKKSFKKEAYL